MRSYLIAILFLLSLFDVAQAQDTYPTKAYQVDWNAPISLGMGNRDIELEKIQDIQRGYDYDVQVLRSNIYEALRRSQRGDNPSEANVQLSGGIQVVSSSPSRSSNRTQSSVRERNRQIRAYNDAVRQRNEEIERYNEEMRQQRRREEEERRRREEARRRILYHEGYTMSMVGSAPYYNNLHNQVEAHAANAEVIRQTKHADGFSRQSGFVESKSGSSGFTKTRSRSNIFPQRDRGTKDQFRDYYPITQFSNYTSSDLKPINLVLKPVGDRGLETQPRRSVISSIDNFLDYYVAVGEGKYDFFTNTVRKVYTNSKEFIGKQTTNITTFASKLMDEEGRDELRKEFKDKAVASAFNKGVAYTKTEDAKDIVVLNMKALAHFEVYTSGAVDAIGTNREGQYLQSYNASAELAREVGKTADKVIGRNLGVSGEAFIEGYETLEKSYKEAEKSNDQEEKKKIFVKESVLKPAKKQVVSDAKKAVKKSALDYWEKTTGF